MCMHNNSFLFHIHDFVPFCISQHIRMRVNKESKKKLHQKQRTISQVRWVGVHIMYNIINWYTYCIVMSTLITYRRVERMLLHQEQKATIKDKWKWCVCVCVMSCLSACCCAPVYYCNTLHASMPSPRRRRKLLTRHQTSWIGEITLQELNFMLPIVGGTQAIAVILTPNAP